MIKKFALLLGFIIFLSAASAEYDLGQNGTNIEEKYNAGDFIRGKINMSFNEHPNKWFTSNFDGGIKLYDLLVNMSYIKGRNFFCNPVNCVDNYVELNSESEQNFSISETEEKYYGFYIPNGEVSAVENIRFNISANVAASCSNQIEIDLFAEGKIDFNNPNFVSETCGEKNFGCYADNDVDVAETKLQNDRNYCELVNVTAAAAYRVGAQITGNNPVGELQFSVYAKNFGTALGYTNVINPQIGEIGVNVVLNKQITNATQLYVCVRELTNNENYKIKVKEGGESCGGAYVGTRFAPGSDYAIFAQSLKYGPLTGAQITSSATAQLATSYLDRVYEKNCGGGCAIPVAFKANTGIDDIRIYNGKLEYTTSGQNIGELNEISSLAKTDFTITLNNTLLDVGKMNIKVPNVNGSENFELYFDNEKVAEKRVNIKKSFLFSIGPRTALVGQETTFTADVENVTHSEWDFGDGSTKVISNNNFAQHKYSNESNYIIEVKVKKQNGEESTRKFSVVVGEAKKSANLTVENYEERIKKLKESIAPLQSWIKSEIEEIIDLTNIESSFTSYKNEYVLLANNGSDEEYVEIIDKITALNLPESIVQSETGSDIPIEIGFKNANLKFAEEISGGDIGNEETLRDPLLAWYNDNYAARVSFKRFSAVTEGEYDDIATSYKIQVEKRIGASSSNDVYLILNAPMSSIVFKEQYEVHSVDERGTYLVIEGEEAFFTFEFLVEEDSAGASTLGAYIAPQLQEINIDAKPLSDEIARNETKISIVKLIIGIVVVFILCLTIYLVLQSWYKRRYESHLFKNPNDLYNIIYFIYNARKSGMNNIDIKKMLIEKKWGREQITYAFKKIDGERTGMWEIPLFKFIENKKVRTEIEKKQQGKPADVRFIKRTGFY